VTDIKGERIGNHRCEEFDGSPFFQLSSDSRYMPSANITTENYQGKGE